MASPPDIHELFRSIDERARARVARIANAKAFGISIVVHAVILFGLLVAASVVKPPWARWSTPVEAPQGRAAAASPALDVVAGAEQHVCASRGDSIVPELVRYVKGAVSGGVPATTGLAALPRGDSSRVWYVEVEEKCRRAARTINIAYQQPEQMGRTIYLIGTGRGYFVADTALGKGRYGKTWVMDSSLARIEGW